jgi:signal transduction histidine kinase
MSFGIISFAMLLVWLCTSWAFRHFFDEVGRAIIEDDLREYSAIYESQGIESVHTLFVAVSHDRNAQALRFADPSGKILIDLPIPGLKKVPWPKFPGRISPDETGIEWLRASLEHGTILTIGRSALSDGSEIWFARTNASDLDAIHQIHVLLLLAMAASAILGCGPVVWFAGRVLRPVNELISSAHRLASGESLDLRLESSTAIPELRKFAGAFNESLDRVQTLAGELEAANDQLAHELRTPLARIRGNIEKILTQSEASPEILEAAARAIDEINRSAALIQRILTIRAGHSGSLKLILKPHSFSDLLEETFDLYSASAEEKELTLKVTLPDEDHILMLDHQRIQQAICNLLDNAIDYTPAGGTIEGELVFESDRAIFHLRDTGPGLSGNDLVTIWERFRRGTAASAGTPGIGLGLSLVRAVAKAHRGMATVQNRPDGGADFSIQLPTGENPKRLSIS